MSRAIAILFLALLLAPAADAARSLDAEAARRAYAALTGAENPVVLGLDVRERAILTAAAALKTDRPGEAIASLAGLDGDPLASLLRAEAHRRQAVASVASVGNYVPNLEAKRRSLEAASLAAGLSEAEVRLGAFLDKLDGVYGDPFDLLALSERVRNVFLVDKARSRLFLYARDETGEFRRVADEYVVTGANAGDKQAEGDRRTPNGIYRFVERLSGAQLADRYGPVAFPIDYPNALDRLHRKNGHGIWMHGFPSRTDRRKPYDTRGCFALPNARLVALAREVELGRSWVVVGESLGFGMGGQKRKLEGEVRRAIESWRRDWESLDTEAYLGHYHEAFRSGRHDLASWKRYKRRVNGNKEFISVTLEDFTIIRRPNPAPEGEAVLVEFDQTYRSDNYGDRVRKRLYLVRAAPDAPWRILVEEEL